MSNQETAQRKESIIAFAIIGTLVLIAVLIFVAHTYHWDLATTTTTEVTQSPKTKVTTTETGKTLLDWLQFVGVLAIPIVVAVGTAVFTTRQTRISEANRKQQHDTEMQITENQQQEELLRTYFDKISDLLLDEEQSSNPKIQSIVRARTLAALHILNTERKTIVLRFLHDSGFLQHVKSFFYVLDLSHTDLNRIDLSAANLRNANLSGANLSAANLSAADLSDADLSDADLSRANLSGADLSRANLMGANLSAADLSAADLSRANLMGANLSSAYLNSADLMGANLSSAYLNGALSNANLRGANLSYANLNSAYLSDADLRGANLSSTDLSDANLSRANLDGAIAIPEQFTTARNVAPEQLARLKSPKSVARYVRIFRAKK